MEMKVHLGKHFCDTVPIHNSLEDHCFMITAFQLALEHTICQENQVE
jgi:hypothetical protein